MIKTKTLSITEDREVKTHIICNMCGLEDSYQSSFASPEFVHLEHEGGYNSRYPGDMTKVELDFCDTCLKKTVKMQWAI